MATSAGNLPQEVGGGRQYLRPSGVLDHAASLELREAISRSLSHGTATLVIDLSAVTVVDAAGLSVLVFGCRAATAAHARLVLSAPSPLVLQLLEPLRLSDLCDVEFEPVRPVPIHGNAA